MNRVLIVGPIFRCNNDLIGPGGLLKEELQNSGFHVKTVSHVRNKVFRMLHIFYVVTFKSYTYDIILLQTFGLSAVIMEDLVSFVGKLLAKPIVMTFHGAVS